MSKVRKLIRDPNRFFFDYFAKRLGNENGRQYRFGADDEGGRALAAERSVLPPPRFTFDPDVHPWKQVAVSLGLRSGGVTGRIDQSLLVRTEQLHDFLLFSFWIAHGMGGSLRVRTSAGVTRLIARESLLNIKHISSTFREVRTVPEFQIEFLSEFANNFVMVVMPYEVNPDGLATLRSPRAFLRKADRESFECTYPLVTAGTADWKCDPPLDVDVVYTWVDRSDPSWQLLWRETFPDREIANDRYASKDELKYSIRSIEKYLPWCRNIFIVSNCSRPAWMKGHSKYRWVTHEEIFPQRGNLPTFNSHAIESCLHRIDGISEHFVYFNDDVFLTSPAFYGDFFDQCGRSKVQLESYGMVGRRNGAESEKDYLAAAANSRSIIDREFPAYSALRLHKHTPQALRRSVIAEMESRYLDAFETTRAARIRSTLDINTTSFLYHHFALATGAAVEGGGASMLINPKNIKKLDPTKGMGHLKSVCFNDGDGSADNQDYIRRFKILVEDAFPLRSSIETGATPWGVKTVLEEGEELLQCGAIGRTF